MTNMRPLLIDDVARQKVQRVVDYAIDPRHWYRPGKTRIVPGHDAHFVAHLDTYRCVFTISVDTKSNETFRHLSISVPSKDFPNPFAAYTIAQLFGFTGWDEKSIDLPAGWMAHVSQAEHCIVIAQPYLVPERVS